MGTTNDEWAIDYKAFKELLLSVKRVGIPQLYEYLDAQTDFFNAPSSTKYHDAEGGGLLRHSLKVYDHLIRLSRLFKADYPLDSLIIIGLLHDVCKANFYSTKYRNVKHEDRPQGHQWEKESYIGIDDKFPLGHGEKSVILVQRYINLTDIEIMGIRWHMMAFDDLHCTYAGNKAITNASDKYPIIVLAHLADLSASFLDVRFNEGCAFRDGDLCYTSEHCQYELTSANFPVGPEGGFCGKDMIMRNFEKVSKR